MRFRLPGGQALWIGVYICVYGWLLISCSPAAPILPSPTSIPPTSIPPTSIPPTSIPTAPVADTQALAALATRELGQAAAVQALNSTALPGFWLAYPATSDDAGVPGLAIYRADQAGWRRITSVQLDMPTVEGGGVQQVALTDKAIWIAVRGRSSLVGPCCFDLLRFDGTQLTTEIHFSERGLQDVRYSTSGEQPEVRIVVQPFGGATATPAPPVELVYVWDGSRMVERTGR